MDQGNARIQEPKKAPNRKKLVIPISWKKGLPKKEKEPWKRSQENTGK